MNKILLVLSALLITCSVGAQITITQADYGQAGDSIVVGYDNAPPSGLSVGGTGMQTWDFTSLSLSNINTLKFEVPSNTTSGSLFPNADLAIERLSDTLFFISTATEFVIDGFSGSGFNLPISIIADFNPDSKQIEFPSTFGDSFVDTAIFDTTVSCAEFGFGSTCDSARLKRILVGTGTFNAFGDISTPGGEFTTVRQYFREDNTDTVWIKVPFLGWINFLDSASTVHNYRWMANGEDWPILSAVADGTGGDIISAEYVVGAQVLGFANTEIDPTCAGACDGSASVYAVGGTPPYSYAWPGGNTQAYANDLCAGTYLVTITDSDTGSYEVTVELTDPAAVSIAGAVQGVSVGGDGAIDISVTGGSNPYTYAWTGPDGFTATTQDISGLEVGDYTVDVTDNNGCDTTRTFTVDLTSIGEDPSLNVDVYPNPVDDLLTLKSTDRIERLEIFDLLGNSVMRMEQNNSTMEISTVDLAPGVYLLQLSTVSGDYLKRISVQH